MATKRKQRKKAVAKAATKQGNLTATQEMFCQLFATDREFFCNGVQSYIEAFDLEPRQYKSAATLAWRLLKKVDIQKRIEELVEHGDLTDAVVDKQLAKLVIQDADFRSKLGGIVEYNKLKNRTKQKVDLTGKVRFEWGGEEEEDEG